MLSYAFIFVVLINSIKADVAFTKDEVMCNCAAPYNNMYLTFQQAINSNCTAYPPGTSGFPSCVANALGYLSNSGRTFNRDALKKDLNNLPFVDSCDPKLPDLAQTAAWIWPGKFNYVDLDKSIGTYLDCIAQTMESDCNTSLVNKIRGCKPGN